MKPHDGNALYPELRDWLMNRITDENSFDTSMIAHSTYTEMLPSIGFGRQTGHTWAILKFIRDTHNKMPPVIYCVHNGLHTTNGILMNMIRANEITEDEATIIRNFVCRPSGLFSTVHTQIIPPALIILDNSTKFHEAAFIGSRLTSPMVIVG